MLLVHVTSVHIIISCFKRVCSMLLLYVTSVHVIISCFKRAYVFSVRSRVCFDSSRHFALVELQQGENNVGHTKSHPS